LFGGVLGHVLVTLELLQRVAFRLLRHVRCRDRLSQLRDLLALPAPSPSSRWIVATCSENCLALPLVERRLGLEADLVADAQDLYAHGEKPRDLVHARDEVDQVQDLPLFLQLRRPVRVRHGPRWLTRGPTGGTRTALLGDDTPRLSNACPNGISNFAGCVRS
jgi:hypothetical protein